MISSIFLASKVCPTLKYIDIFDLWEPITIVILNESLQTIVCILPVGQCTPDKNVTYEMTSRKNIKIFDFNVVNVAKHWHVVGARYLPSLIALLPLCFDIIQPCCLTLKLAVWNILWCVLAFAIYIIRWKQYIIFVKRIAFGQSMTWLNINSIQKTSSTFCYINMIHLLTSSQNSELLG